MMSKNLLFSSTLVCLILFKAKVDAKESSRHGLRNAREECTDSCDVAGMRAFTVDEEAESRIVGGKEARPHAWPWQVLLSFSDRPSCGGSIIRPQWVLTAAHCFKRYIKETFWTVMAGKHDLENETESCQQVVSVRKIITHKSYNSLTKSNDIALVMLGSPLSFDNCVRPISTWQGPVPFLKLCTVTGWGLTTENGPQATTLQEANVTILEVGSCFAYYKSVLLPMMFCAGRPEGGVDACQGDSGSPLSCFSNGTYQQVGLVSWGVGCGRPNKPGVYTSVAQYASWINSIINAKHEDDEPENAFKVADQCGRAKIQPCRLDKDLAGLKDTSKTEPTLTNVNEACPHSWPWQVSLQSQDNHYCSGTLIHPLWVLAPRHCRVNVGDAVVLGAHDLGLAEGQSVTVKEIQNPKFAGSLPPRNNLSLLYLSAPAQLGDSIFPACLADNPMYGTSCVTTGWGFESATSEQSANVLYQAHVQPLREEACWSGQGQTVSADSVLCTDAAASPSCMGDPGAPLLCIKNGIYYLVGLMSWGSRKCDPTKPAAFTKVSEFKPWIESFINDKRF